MINDATNFFENLLTQTEKKSEIKLYKNFIGILFDLKNRNLTKEQIRSIEEELELLKLNEIPLNKKKYVTRKLNEFKKYLKEEFSLISEGYYTGIGLALGTSFGIVIGTMFKETIGVSMGLGFGMLLGLIIGKTMDLQAEKQNRVLKTKMK